MNRFKLKQLLHKDLCEALGSFIVRQQLVVRAVVDQGVDLEALTSGVVAWYNQTSQVGTWNNDWEFFFHGGGCELRHRLTGEPIDWNGPDPLAFGSMAFVHHLDWRLKNAPGLPALREFVAERDPIAVLALIDELVADGLITPDRHLSNVRNYSS